MDDARRRTLHGRRRGKKLRAGQQSLLDTLLPRLLLALPADAADNFLSAAFDVDLSERVDLDGGVNCDERLSAR